MQFVSFIITKKLELNNNAHFPHHDFWRIFEDKDNYLTEGIQAQVQFVCTSILSNRLGTFSHHGEGCTLLIEYK